MRSDLSFLYDRAIRSKDFNFMDCVFGLLDNAGMDFEAKELSDRIYKFMCLDFNVWPSCSKFQFLIDDSYFGYDWFRTQ